MPRLIGRDIAKSEKANSYPPTRCPSGPRPILALAALIGVLSGCSSGESPAKKTYTLTVVAGEHGTVTPSGGAYREGTVVALAAVPDKGYRLSFWKGTDNDASTSTSNAVTMNGNRTVEAGFASPIAEGFEGSGAAAEWTFSNGPEFPGAAGSFTVGAGRGRAGSRAGVLAFDFTGGGAYVAATRRLSAPVPLKGLSFWIVGYVLGSRVLVRLEDETGQTFQYFPTIGTGAESSWVQVRLLLGDWDSSWGTAADGVFHGGVRVCTIGIEKGVRYHPTGEMAIDEIAELASAEIAFDPFGADARPEFYTGPVSPLLGVNIHFLVPDAELLDKARAAGFGFVRMDMSWDTIERSPGVYRFDAHERLIQALEERGMGALFIVDNANPLYYDGPGAYDYMWGPRTDGTRNAFARFVLAAARYFSGRNVMLEVWNEPNLSTFWHPVPNPADYGLLVAATSRTVKGQISNVPIIVGATSGCDAAFLDQALSAAGSSYGDAVSIHPYRSTAPETFVQDRALVRDVIRRKTGRTDIPLYSGEWGYSSSWFGGRTEAAWKKQAAYAARTILINLLDGVPRTVWYDLIDDGPDPADGEHNFGLLSETKAPKPAYRAVKALPDLLPGREGGGAPANSWKLCAVETRANDVFALLIHNDRGKLAALWTSHKNGAVEAKIPDAAALKFFDMFGGAATSVRREGGWCYVSLAGDEGPVYVKY